MADELDHEIDTPHYDYKNELKIDHNALDIEWLNQPALFMKYADASTHTKTDWELAKQKLDVVRAEVETDIRKNPIAYAGTDAKKLTESYIQALITAHPLVQEAEKNVIRTRHIADLFSMMVKAFDQRKYALQMAVTLFGQKYFAGPVEPRDLDMEFDRKVKQADLRQRISKKLNKKDEQNKQET